MEHRGVEITLIETCGGGERVEVGDYKVGRRNGQIFGAMSKHGEAWSRNPQTALSDCKTLIDAALKRK